MRSLLTCCLATFAVSACAPSAAPDGVTDGVAVPEGKEDDFFSASAAEYVLEGRTTVTLEANLAGAPDEVKDARVRELIGYKQIAIAWFLTQYLVDKEPDASNASFGGFGGLAKGGAYEDLDVVATSELTYAFSFKQIIAGRRELINLLPVKAGEGGRPQFDLAIGRPSNAELARLETNSEWYRSAPWSGWNPDEVSDSKKEIITFSIEVERESTDAWWDYAALAADGVIDIDIHFGWDYHNAFHVKHARALFGWLESNSFTAPVDSFDKLEHDSGAFTRTLEADGRELRVEVRLFYGKTGSVTEPDTDAGGIVLEEDMRSSLASRDVIIYSGHSGPFYGFALGNWKKTAEGDFDDSEMASVQMPDERYQIVFAEGCDTYHIGEAFKRNPAKPDGRFIDIITTTSFSNASTPAAVQDFLGQLIEIDGEGRHHPRTLRSLLTNLDANSSWFHTMYGIHGIDDNPALHPYAKPELLCSACDSDDDCGGPGNLCVGVGASGDRVCASACTADRGCPDSYTCASIASQSSREIYAKACVPADYSCR